jgi:hypothetical protein
VSSPEQLVKILEARYSFDYAPREFKGGCERVLLALVDEAIKDTQVSRYELLSSIHDRYLVFKREKRKMERVAIAQRLR